MRRAATAATSDTARRCRHFDPTWLAGRLRSLVGPLGGRQLCLAYSGGVDSTALLHALVALRRRLRFRLRALHIDHRLQPAAARWAAAAAARGRAWRVPVQIVRVRVPLGGSLEAAARAVRYAALAARLAPGELLLTAHNQDDQLETVLLQLVRGAGLAGLAAMPERVRFAAGWLLRPLLPVPRVLLQHYLEAVKVSWSEDPSNTDERFDRSYLRRRVVPALRARWPAVAATVSRSARHAAEAQELLAAVAERALDAALDGTALKVSALRRLAPPQRRALLRQWIARRGCTPPEQRQLDELALAVVHARSDAQPLLRWGDHELRRHGDRLHLGVPHPPPPAAPVAWSWHNRRQLTLPGGGRLQLRADRHGEVAVARLPPRLELRFRAGGERLPTSAGRRALKNLLQQRRIPPWLRMHLPLLCIAERIIAVPGVWVAPEIAARAGETRRARLVWQPPPEDAA